MQQERVVARFVVPYLVGDCQPQRRALDRHPERHQSRLASKFVAARVVDLLAGSILLSSRERASHQSPEIRHECSHKMEQLTPTASDENLYRNGVTVGS